MGRAISPEGRLLTARLAEVGVELTPANTDRLVAAGRAALRAAGSTGVALEFDGGWGLEFVVDDESETIQIDVFLIEQDDAEDPSDDEVDA